jgi:hypothetical protein
VPVMRSWTSAIHDLKLLIFNQANGSIMYSLVKIAQFGMEKADRVSLPSHDNPQNKETCVCMPW